jgi:hypothetical protein
MKKFLFFKFKTHTGIICVIDLPESKMVLDNLKKISDEMKIWLSKQNGEEAQFMGFGNRVMDFGKDLDPATLVCDVKIDGKGFE